MYDLIEVYPLSQFPPRVSRVTRGEPNGTAFILLPWEETCGLSSIFSGQNDKVDNGITSGSERSPQNFASVLSTRQWEVLRHTVGMNGGGTRQSRAEI